MLDFDLFTRVIDEAGPDAGPGRLLQLRRGVPAQARRRDVRVHQDEVPAHLPLHQHQRPGPERGEGAAAGPLGHRRGDLLDRRRVAGHLRALPPARQVRPGHRQPAGDGRREGQGTAATCRSSTGATSSSSGTTPTRRWRRRGGSPSSSASIACRWEITDHPEDSFSRRFAPGHVGLRAHQVRGLGSLGPRQRHSRAPRRAPRSSCRRCRPTPRCRAAPGETLTVQTHVRNLSTRPFRKLASYGRRLVRLGAQLVGRRRRAHQPRLRAGVAAGRHPGRRRRPTCRSTCRCRRAPGRYALKFDLVSEGIDWFEKCGSPTTTRSVWVR